MSCANAHMYIEDLKNGNNHFEIILTKSFIKVLTLVEARSRCDHNLYILLKLSYRYLQIYVKVILVKIIAQPQKSKGREEVKQKKLKKWVGLNTVIQLKRFVF